MLTLGAYEKCKRYIESHSKETKETSRKKELFPCITISHQTGAGSYEVSEKLIKILDKQTKESEQNGHTLIKSLLKKLLKIIIYPKL